MVTPIWFKGRNLYSQPVYPTDRQPFATKHDNQVFLESEHSIVNITDPVITWRIAGKSLAGITRRQSVHPTAAMRSSILDME